MSNTDYTDLKHRLHRYSGVLAIIALCLLGLVNFVWAQQDSFPAYRGFVNDFANLLEPADHQKLNALVGAVEQKTGAEIVVVTLKSTKPYNVEDYAIRLAEKWQIGKADKDNGLLFLVAAEDRKMAILTGYGLEGAIPDAEATRVRLRIITPYFKREEYSKGILAGTIALVDLTAQEYNISIEDLPDLTKAYVQPVQKSPLAGFIEGFFTLLFFILFFGLRMGLFGFLLFGSGRRRGGYWYGGGLSGGGAGFGGFGGGSFGGGGSWGGW